MLFILGAQLYEHKLTLDMIILFSELSGIAFTKMLNKTINQYEQIKNHILIFLRAN